MPEEDEIAVFTPNEMLWHGLLAVGYEERRIQRVGMSKNLSRFRQKFCSHPRVYSDLFTLLQTTDIEEARLDCSVFGVGKTLDYFFMGIYLLAKYPTEQDAETAFASGPCDRTWRKHAWNIVHKISSLFPDVIEWPVWWGNPQDPEKGEPEFVITVDGMHCMIEEPTFDDFAENKKYYSHKFHSAGLDYEVALSIFQPKCVWVAGPYPAGKHDITIFRHKLKQKLLDSRNSSGVKHRGIADRGYRGEATLLTVPNSLDTAEVRDFKGRALSRQETFNCHLKFFDCLDEHFRHGVEKHKHCFYACVVIVQLQMDNGFPIFNV